MAIEANDVAEDTVAGDGAGADTGGEPAAGGAGDTNQAAGGGAQGAPAKKWQVKVNGQVRELTEAEAQKYLSKELAGDEKLRNASQMAKAVKAFEDKFNADPMSALTQKFGAEKARAMMEDVLLKHYQEQNLSPAQKAAKESERRLSEREAKIKETEEKLEKAEFTRKAEAFAAQFDADATAAMDKVGLPRDWASVHRVTELAAMAIDNDIDLDFEDIAAKVKDERTQGPRKFLDAMSVDELVQVLGDKRMEELRKHNLQKLRPQTGGGASRRPTQGKPAAKSETPVSHLSWDDRIEKLKGALK